MTRLLGLGLFGQPRGSGGTRPRFVCLPAFGTTAIHAASLRNTPIKIDRARSVLGSFSGFRQRFRDRLPSPSTEMGRPDDFQKGAISAAERQRQHRKNLAQRRRPDPKTLAKQRAHPEREAAEATKSLKPGRRLFRSGVSARTPSQAVFPSCYRTGPDRRAATRASISAARPP